jgi:hypothetical protein
MNTGCACSKLAGEHHVKLLPEHQAGAFAPNRPQSVLRDSHRRSIGSLSESRKSCTTPVRHCIYRVTREAWNRACDPAPPG